MLAICDKIFVDNLISKKGGKMDFNLDSITNAKPVSDDPELAKALAGLNGDMGEGLQFEGIEQSVLSAEPEVEAPVVEPTLLVNEEAVMPAPSASASNGDLDDIKNHALQDLRPLMGKLDVSAEEKFNIYLLLLRSSDDKSLIEPAYAAAREIEDEVKKANALLDVIKEIDYLNSKA